MTKRKENEEMAPAPPSRSNVDETWTKIQPGIRSTFNMEPLDMATYMMLYNQVYACCTKVMELEPRSEPLLSQKNGPISKSSYALATENAKLYEKLKSFLEIYVTELVPKFCGDCPGKLLECYCEAWRSFRFSAKVCSGVFSYLNRNQIGLENLILNVDTQKYPLVYSTCLREWRKYILAPIEKKVVRAAWDIIDHERNTNGACTDIFGCELIRDIVGCLVELGALIHVYEADSRGKLQVYREGFEAHFLDDTEAFYFKESEKFLQDNSVTDYIRQVHKWMDEEDERCKKYLHISTLEPIKQRMIKTLIVRQLDALQKQFRQLWLDDKQEEEKKLYELFRLVPESVPDLHTIFQEEVQKYGHNVIKAKADQILNDPRLFADVILDIYDRSTKFLATAFDNEKEFQIACQKALFAAFNDNEVTKSAKSPLKIPELLVRYTDILLKKGSKNREDREMDAELDRVMILFDFINDKDVFEKYYSVFLAKRFIEKLSAGEDLEQMMINKLKRMYLDVTLTKTINPEFREYLMDKESRENREKFNYDFEVQVLTSGNWPIKESPDITVPKELETSLTQFHVYYKMKQQGRKLRWVFEWGRCELKAVGYNKPYLITTTTYQATILLLMANPANSKAESVTIEELQAWTCCSDPGYLVQALATLMKPKEKTVPPLIVLANSTMSVDEAIKDQNTAVKLNPKFQTNKMKFSMVVPVLKPVTVDESRSFEIQATIVRIMKMRKTLGHQQLIGEVMEQSRRRFNPEVPLIKKSIETLIEKEYLKRSEEDQSTYIYVA